MGPASRFLTAHYRADIDGLRALAVAAVMGFHLFPGTVRGGFVGVDIFFVISGFLISGILITDLEKGAFSIGRFYARRIRRIFPSLLIVLFSSWIAGWFVLLTSEYAQLGRHIAGGAGFVANLLYWAEAGYFDRAADTKPLLHLWSLGVEEQFYVVWPLLLFLIWRVRRFRVRALLLMLFASFTFSVVKSQHDAAAAFYSPVTRFWELLAGGGLAYATRDPRAAMWGESALVRNLCSAAGLALIAVAVVRIDKAAVFPGWKALIPVAGAFLAICAGPRAWLNRHLLSRRALVWIGLISYPLYLWHWPLLSFVRIVNGPPSPAIRITIVVLSVVLATLTYWLIERPIRIGPASPRRIIVLCGFMLLAGVAGLDAVWTRGFPERLPRLVQQIADFSYDQTLDYRLRDCFLAADQDARAFGPGCVDADPSRQNLKEVVLWGDSHAAHLYPGLKASYQATLRISQLTAAGCAPLFDVKFVWDYCPAVNVAILQTIARLKPDIVVLAAQWNAYDWKAVSKTIDELKRAGVGEIVVVGHVPSWDEAFPKILARIVLRNRRTLQIPDRTTVRLSQDTLALDREMSEFIRNTGATYQAVIPILCNQEGCLTHTGQGIEGILQFDEGHLTRAGSIYVVSHFRHLE